MPKEEGPLEALIWPPTMQVGKQFQREEGPSLRPESESVTEPGPESGTGFPGLVTFPLSQEGSTRTVEVRSTGSGSG